MRLKVTESLSWKRWGIAVLVTLMAVGAAITRSAESQQKTDRVPDPLRTLYSLVSKDFPDVPDLTVAELERLMGQSGNVVLIDRRPAVERRVSTIPGAVSLDEWERRAASGTPSIVVPFCTIGYRSASTVQSLRKRGIDARNLAGGVLAWSHAERDFIQGGQPTKRVHVYGPRWNVLPSGYSGVW